MNTTDVLVKTRWAIDAAHSEVQFKVKHLVISTVTGFFKKFSGDIESEGEDFNGAKANFTIDSSSIDTNAPDRDNHLKSPDFFAAEQHPAIVFNNGVLEKVEGNTYRLKGELTIRETTKTITLDVQFGGQATDPWGNVRAGFEINGKINRKDFGLNWSAVTEAGGLVVADDVKLHINAEVVKQPA